ncbi:hypothetical protein H4Q32_020360 [Labeo rohita]|uniref:Retrotransposon gag domain-containing protein n=1 Tax=Labeo rohita TaxID=84645 RepID=A0ABQ8LF41_LABRO|nr:hypothetical protein H4Q32_020360 [Labeo rohita]
MDSIVTETVRLDLTKKFGIDPEKVGHNKASTKSDSNDQQSDESYPDLQSLCRQEDKCNTRRIEKDATISVEGCGARQRAQSRVEGVETVPSATPIFQLQAVHPVLGPEDIERLSQSLPSAHTNFSEFRRALTSKMRLYDMSLAEVTQLMSQILTESEFNSFESAVTSELQHASKADLREGVLKILKNIMGPKIDWSRITNCVQRKDETVNEYTVRFCQTAVTYSGIVDDSESVLDDKGPLVRIWSDGLVADSEADPPHYTKLVGQLAEVLTVKAGQTRTHRPVRSLGKNRSATGLGGQPCGEDFLIGFSPHQFVPTSLVCVHAMMSSKAASWSKASPQTSMNKLHEDKESSE